MAATQSCGPMAAPFESMVKRIRHGFASRAGRLLPRLPGTVWQTARVTVRAHAAMGPHAPRRQLPKLTFWPARCTSTPGR